MNPVGKALWFIESHVAGEITLEDVARASGVSRYYLVRAFGLAPGLPVMRYLRARRLTEAARRLAGGAPDILAVALDAGYGSHEAFTRAFRDQFGVTPEQARARGGLHDLRLMEPIRMDETLLEELDAPRFVELDGMLVAGLAERYSSEDCAGIPGQWQRFVPHLGTIPCQVGRATYGVLYNGDDAGNSDYLCGVEVSDFSRLPPGFSRLRIPPQHYAVFLHKGHVSATRRTWFTIWNRWFPESGQMAAEGPEFERYGESFDPVSGNGGFEIWIPVKR